MNSAAGMLCPTCRVALVMSERSGIEIDYCPQCRGIWLDRGELDKIIERSARESAPAPQPQQQGYAQTSHQQPQQHQQPQNHQQGYDSRYQQPYGQKRKKSFLEELFD
ncbi:MAG: zf-TFIIB domain-containing protein [Rhizobium sp.]|nr:zf-TFIIB domain-containing protein [Rhizobium sp.]